MTNKSALKTLGSISQNWVSPTSTKSRPLSLNPLLVDAAIHKNDNNFGESKKLLLAKINLKKLK